MKVDQCITYVGFLAAVASIICLIFNIYQKNGVVETPVEPTASIAGLLISIPSLSSLAFRLTLRTSIHAPRTSQLGDGLSAEEMLLFLIGSSVFAFVWLLPSTNSYYAVNALQSIGNSTAVYTILPLLSYL